MAGACDRLGKPRQARQLIKNANPATGAKLDLFLQLGGELQVLDRVWDEERTFFFFFFFCLFPRYDLTGPRAVPCDVAGHMAPRPG